MNDPAALQDVKNRIWFYQFELPDGSHTAADYPEEILKIHTSRRNKLRKIIENHVGVTERTAAIDFASHEGYYSVELAKHFTKVVGLEFRQQSILAANSITKALGIINVDFRQVDLQTLHLNDEIDDADFILLYGLLHHVENPIHVLRLASRLCKKHILIDTQVSTFDVSGRIEDSHYRAQRKIEGHFTFVGDYPDHREGGSTDLHLFHQ
jgi:tRNA (mo5U34)-methyltransferase